MDLQQLNKVVQVMHQPGYQREIISQFFEAVKEAPLGVFLTAFKDSGEKLMCQGHHDPKVISALREGILIGIALAASSDQANFKEFVSEFVQAFEKPNDISKH